MPKQLGIFVAGLVVGLSLAALLGKTEKKFVRTDAVTIERRDLQQIIDAIQLVKDRPAGNTYTRYEAAGGHLAFECPTGKACNLEVPAAARVAGLAPRSAVVSEQGLAAAEVGPQPLAPSDSVSAVQKAK